MTDKPIYSQITQKLREMARDKRMTPGTRFVTERQVSELFGISRATANKALSVLVAEGLLEFRKGIGTFIKNMPLDNDLRSLVSFTYRAESAGKVPSTVTRRFELQSFEETDDQIRTELHLSPDDYVYYMERLRLADDHPVILERRFLVARLCPGITKEITEGSLYELLSKKYSLEVANADQVISAVSVKGDDAAMLRVKIAAPCLLITAVARLADGSPIWFERTLYKGDAYEFHNRLVREAEGHSPMGILRIK